jgi:hypothetical protein
MKSLVTAGVTEISLKKELPHSFALETNGTKEEGR